MKKRIVVIISTLLFVAVNSIVFSEEGLFTFDEMKKTINDTNYNLRKAYGYKTFIAGDKSENLVKSEVFNLKYRKYTNDAFSSIENLNIKSSSVLDNKKYYAASNVIDGKLETAWVEGNKGFGKKEWVSIETKNKIVYNKVPFYVAIFPGYGKNTETFYSNNRIKSIVVKIYNSNIPKDWGDVELDHRKNYELVRYEFEDSFKYHIFYLCNEMSNNGSADYKFTFYIESVYKGKKYDDTCISEIVFLDREYVK